MDHPGIFFHRRIQDYNGFKKQGPRQDAGSFGRADFFAPDQVKLKFHRPFYIPQEIGVAEVVVYHCKKPSRSWWRRCTLCPDFRRIKRDYRGIPAHPKPVPRRRGLMHPSIHDEIILAGAGELICVRSVRLSPGPKTRQEAAQSHEAAPEKNKPVFLYPVSLGRVYYLSKRMVQKFLYNLKNNVTL
jgi:hypothetical protein